MVIGQSYNEHWIEHDINTSYWIVSCGGHEWFYAFSVESAYDYINNR